MDDQSDKPYFHISVVAQMLELHPQTIRNYERLGLLRPSRTEGNVRLYSQKDVEKVKKINTYTNMGVNLAGVEIILKLLEQMEEMEKNMQKAMDEMERDIYNPYEQEEKPAPDHRRDSI